MKSKDSHIGTSPLEHIDSVTLKIKSQYFSDFIFLKIFKLAIIIVFELNWLCLTFFRSKFDDFHVDLRVRTQTNQCNSIESVQCTVCMPC